MKKILLSSIIALSFASAASANTICESKRNFWSGLVAGAVGTAAGIGATGKALGYYSIKNGVTGAYMLGSTAIGKSAAGTVGIIGGTSGIVGTTSAFLLSTPVLLTTGAVVATGVAALEGYCYLAKD
jgi:hypothetical protein|tara:strand:+ start:60 stop:440 length:381 start_codon:yes stop_codon:yes gene_type:complete